jgi:hypothetical protein
MRVLSSHELDLVAGGFGSTDDAQINRAGAIYEGGGFGSTGGGGGGGGGFGGGFWYWVAPASYFTGEDGAYAPGGQGSWRWIPSSSGGGYGGGSPSGTETGGDGPALDLKGRDCAAEKSAAQDALNELYRGSATAKGLIDTAKAKYVGLELIKTDVSVVGGTPHNRFDWEFTNNIQWDPFVAIKGVNSNGSTYYVSPIMALAHELVHAAHVNEAEWQGNDSEAKVMVVTNKIAKEVNLSTGSGYDTSRDNHSRASEYYVSSIRGSTIQALTRPGCQ